MSKRSVAIKSPEYFPRLAYVALMQSVDVFVLADTFQYSRQSYQNRARIRTPQGWHWISVPLVGRQHGRPILETRIDNRTHWGSKHLRSIIFNYSQTPYFAFVEEAVTGILQKEWSILGNLTCQSISLTHELFGLGSQMVRASDLSGSPASVRAILEATRATELVVDAQDGRFHEGGYPRRAVSFTEPVYRQHFAGFEPGISALDLICNYGPEASKTLLTGTQRTF